MIWSRITPYCQRADTGHQISAAKGTDGWRFSAWTPPEQPALSYWKWSERAHHKTHYRRGEPVPQRSQCLGIFTTRDAAAAACAAHHAEREA